MDIEYVKGLKKFIDDDIVRLQIKQSYDNYKLKLENNTRLLKLNRKLYDRLLKKRLDYALQLGNEIKKLESEKPATDPLAV
jgi:hypothetical protein